MVLLGKIRGTFSKIVGTILGQNSNIATTTTTTTTTTASA